MKTIVVSAVNLKVGGTLTILRDCLQYLSKLGEQNEYKIIALVHKKELAFYPHIIYVELDWPKKSWVGRLWCEYVTMKKISKELAPVYLWLSLHDTTPNVEAERRVVYCHNSFPFYKWKAREWLFTPKIVMFALFSKWIYRINIHRNDYIVVQQQWFKRAFQNWFNIEKDSIIIAPPSKEDMLKSSLPVPGRASDTQKLKKSPFIFFYAGAANSHKNFEVLCAAARILTERLGKDVFEVHLTIRGSENAYARWLYGRWGNVESLKFRGFLSKNDLYDLYHRADSLVFPSKIETWGLPITEFAAQDKPMILADLPYAHETSSGCNQVCYFDPDDSMQLAKAMQNVIQGDLSGFRNIPKLKLPSPVANSWQELFRLLLK